MLSRVHLVRDACLQAVALQLLLLPQPPHPLVPQVQQALLQQLSFHQTWKPSAHFVSRATVSLYVVTSQIQGLMMGSAFEGWKTYCTSVATSSHGQHGQDALLWSVNVCACTLACGRQAQAMLLVMQECTQGVNIENRCLMRSFDECNRA